MATREECEAGLVKIRDILVGINDKILDLDLADRDADTNNFDHVMLRAARERTLSDYHKLKEYMQNLPGE